MSAPLTVGDTSRTSAILAVALLAALLAALSGVFEGFSVTDRDIASVFDAMAHGRTPHVMVREGYMLEPIAPNLVGSALAVLGLHGLALLLVWWTLGVVALALAFAFAGENGLGWAGVVVLLCATRLSDLAVLWIGKADPYTLALFTVAATARSRPVSALAAFGAALCHPAAAVIALTAALPAQALTGRRIAWELTPAALAGAALDEACYHHFFAATPDRAAFARLCAHDIVRQGFVYWSMTSLSAVIAPALFLLALSPATVEAVGRRWRAALMVGGYLLAVGPIASVVTYDHTRVAILLSFPVFVLLAAQISWPRRDAVLAFATLLCAALAYRWAAPHVTQVGMRYQRWGQLAHELRLDVLPAATMDKLRCPIV